MHLRPMLAAYLAAVLAEKSNLGDAEALAAYTLGPARTLGVGDEGHLRPGARADLAVLSVDRETLLAVDERVAGARSILTLVNGSEVPLA